MRLVKRGYIRRGAAILLLLFVVADITSSDVCGEKLELLGFPNSCIASFASSSANRRTIPAAIRYSQQNETSQSLPEDDDCLCWCPHVLPTLVFDFITSRIEPPITDSIDSLLPSSPPPSLFHPPRSA